MQCAGSKKNFFFGPRSMQGAKKLFFRATQCAGGKKNFFFRPRNMQGAKKTFFRATQCAGVEKKLFPPPKLYEDSKKSDFSKLYEHLPVKLGFFQKRQRIGPTAAWLTIKTNASAMKNKSRVRAHL